MIRLRPRRHRPVPLSNIGLESISTVGACKEEEPVQKEDQAVCGDQKDIPFG